MDYEKKQRLIALRDSMKEYGYADGVEELESIFPELTESEGEKIRKALVWHLKADVDFVSNGVTKAECLAYLEKQKEQKPRLIGEDSVEKKARQMYENGQTIEVQKLAGWSDTNELVFQDICKHLKEEGYNGWIVLLNALHNGEFQPKQEWSEEDEKMRNALLEWLNPEKGGTKYSSYAQLAEWRNWLKSLRPQPHWKPSEDQMSMLLAVIRDPNNAGSESCFLAFKSLYEDLKKL